MFNTVWNEIDMASACMILRRSIATSCVCHGKRNFRKFLLYNKRGSRQFKKSQTEKTSDIPIDKRGVKDVGLKINGRFVTVPEMIPELIVPSLEGFKLKPYVSYQVEHFDQGEFTAQDLFNMVYSKKVEEDFANGQLDENGEPLNPSEYEQLTPQRAKENAEKTGCDMFTENIFNTYNN
ncbi:39S ribosomal protein L41, mitochondrial isoform X2 [Harpegnathos saltator]|uniref:39S ribosomal protein L41, mitochondrial isoform X2 n=1 Tax=Harpegnathos saltator TaxID=610380 RepID=UPI00058B171A|nr:39S ribosomal protein L41, mitochondrial isoform X2 [Harpegnathos saltator]